MKFLIVDDMHESIVPLLATIGVDATYSPLITKQEVLEQISNYEGIVIRSKIKIDVTFLGKATKLKFIARAGAGLDQIDVEEVAKRSIQIVNAPEGNRDALGEHTLGLLLALTNKICFGNSQVRSKIWDREANRGYELAGKTIGLLGYGNMAQAFAKRAKAIGCNVIAYDKYKTGFSDDVVNEATMEQVWEQSDVFSIHIPLTEETRALVDENYLSKFKKPIWFLNTARGPIVKLVDLYSSLKSLKVLGAGLDVIENEKLNKLSEEEKGIFEQLLVLENVILTPHVAGWSFESYERINTVIVSKLKSLLN